MMKSNVVKEMEREFKAILKESCNFARNVEIPEGCDDAFNFSAQYAAFEYIEFILDLLEAEGDVFPDEVAAIDWMINRMESRLNFLKRIGKLPQSKIARRVMYQNMLPDLKNVRAKYES